MRSVRKLVVWWWPYVTPAIDARCNYTAHTIALADIEFSYRLHIFHRSPLTRCPPGTFPFLAAASPDFSAILPAPLDASTGRVVRMNAECVGYAPGP